MSGVSNRRAMLGQANGDDVELIVSGTERYATYQTLDRFPAVYDDELGLYAYARVVDGRFESTGVPVGSSPPPDVHRDATEADHVRAEKIAARDAQMDSRAQTPNEEKDP